ncbi:MAG: TolC family protein [Planctomycetota bacterium]
MKLRLGACLAALAAGGGCFYDYTVPSDAYLESLATYRAAAVPVPEPEAVPEEVDLATCVRLVVANNPAVADALADARLAALNVDVARSYFIPKVRLSAIDTWYLDDTSAKPAGYPGDTVLNGQLMAQYLVYDFGISRYLLGQRYRLTDAARAGARAAADGLAGAAAGLFYRILAMGEDLAAMDESLKTLAARVADAERLYAAGRLPQGQVLTLQVALENLRYNRTALAAGRDKGLLSLKTLMGVVAARPLRLAAGGEAPVPELLPDAEALVAVALECRADLAAARAAVEAARFGVDAADAMRWPLFLINAGMVYSDLDREFAGNGGVSSQVNLTMSWDIYTGGEKETTVRMAEEQVLKARLALRRATDQAREEILAALVDVATLRAQDASLDLAVTGAGRNLRDAEARFQAGQGTAADLINAQAALLAARGNRTRARFDLLAAYYALAQSTGGPLERFAPPAPEAVTDMPGPVEPAAVSVPPIDGPVSPAVPAAEPAVAE